MGSVQAFRAEFVVAKAGEKKIDKVLFPRSAPAEKFRNKNVCIIFLRGVPFPHIRRDDSHL